MQRFDAQLEAIDRSRGTSRLFKGLGGAGFAVGGVSLVVYACGQVANAIDAVGHALGNAATRLADDLLPGGGSRRQEAWRPTNYTPVLGVAAVGVLVGIASTIVGVKLGRSNDREREELQRSHDEISLQLPAEKDDLWRERTPPAEVIEPVTAVAPAL